MAIFKIVKYVHVYGNDEEDTLNNVNQLVSSANPQESYKMRFCPKLSDDGQWKAIVELATSDTSDVSKKDYMPGEGNKKLLKKVKELEKIIILEHLMISPQTARDYIDSLGGCFGIQYHSQEETLDSLQKVGLYKTADNYGLPRDGLLKIHDLNIRSIQDYLDCSKKRPVQKIVADKLRVTTEYLEDLRQRKLA